MNKKIEKNLIKCVACAYPIETNNKKIFYCPQCDIIFTEQKYTYKEEYFKNFREEGFKKNRSVVFSDFAKNRIIKNLLSLPINVLDIGCATGDFIDFCGKLTNKWVFTGLDVSDAALNLAKKKKLKSHFEQGNLNDYADLWKNKFDLVFCSHTLEHIFSQAEFLNDIFKVLKTGGLLYLEIPNERSDLFFLYKNLFNKESIERHYLKHPYGHVVYHSNKSLRRLLEKNIITYFKFKQFPLVSVGKNWKIYTTEKIKKFIFHILPFFHLSDRIVVIIKKS